MRIRVLDIETTGFDPAEGGVCEIGSCDVISNTVDLTGRPYDWQVDLGRSSQCLCNPGVDIPPQASAIHHLTNEDTAFALDWRLAVRSMLDPDLREVDEEPFTILAAHSAKFERAWIGSLIELPWICSYKAALRLWPDAPSHSNQALRYWRRPAGLDRELATPAHRAFPDAYVTAHLLRDMLNDGATVEQLIEWTDQPALQVTCHIGKFRGVPWREIDDGFLYWVSERDFDEDVLFTVRHEMERRRQEEEQRLAAHDPVGGSDEVPF